VLLLLAAAGPGDYPAGLSSATASPLPVSQSTESINGDVLGRAIKANNLAIAEPGENRLLDTGNNWSGGSTRGEGTANASGIERLPSLTDVLEPIIAADDSARMRYYDPFSTQFAFGNRGVQPYRFGWYSYDDATYFPTSRAQGVSGSFQALQWTSWMRYSRVVGNQMVLSWTPQWNSIFWTGPTGVALPADVDQITSDLQISSIQPGPWNWQVGVTPQINTDFKRALNSNAYMVDGRAVLFYRPSAQWRLALGAAYWNRVHDLIIPYGGVIWTPDDRWEFRIFFPKTRISRYCGTVWGANVWAYASAEYEVQAYQIRIANGTADTTRMQISDCQFLLGCNAQRNAWTAFVEGGLVSDRHVAFRGAVPNFGLSDGLMARIGILY
jgi:hypothetical protein